MIEFVVGKGRSEGEVASDTALTPWASGDGISVACHVAALGSICLAQKAYNGD